MHTAIIIDDEAKGRMALREKISSYCPEIQLLAEAANGKEGIDAIEKYHPRIVFLDIEMPGMSGFDMLNRLSAKNFHIIFTTAYNQYAIKAIKYAAFDYLLKPIDIEELKEAIGKIILMESDQTPQQLDLLRENLSHPKRKLNKLAIPTLDGLLFYNIEDIHFLEANSNYTNIIFNNGSKSLASKTLKDFEELLPADIFFRPHHSYIINLNFIKRYIKGDGGQIEMQNGTYIEVSRRKKEEFLQLMR
jgi:two-component system, LytTR family, response regulator